MGHHGRAGAQEPASLRRLTRTVSRVDVQRDAPSPVPLLHGQPDRSTRLPRLRHAARLLPARRQSPEDRALHKHPIIAHRILPHARRGDPADVARRSAARQVFSLHDDTRRHVRDRHGVHVQRPLSLARHAHDARLGAQDIPVHTAAHIAHASAEDREQPGRAGMCSYFIYAIRNPNSTCCILMSYFVNM